MPKLSIEIDDLTYNVIQKNNAMWDRDTVTDHMGVVNAANYHIWTGTSGFLTTTILHHPSWKFPFWVREQTRPESPGYVPMGLCWGNGPAWNQRYRDITMVGLRDKVDEPVISPDGFVMIRRNSASLTFWIYEDGKLLAVGEEGKLTQKLKSGYLPIVETNWSLDDKDLSLETFASELDDYDVCMTRATVKNKSKKKKNIVLFAVVTPWGPFEFNPITELGYKKDINGFVIDSSPFVLFEDKPDSFTCHNYEDGDVSLDARNGKLLLNQKSKCKVGYCTGALAFKMALEPGEERSIIARMPIVEKKLTKKNLEEINSVPFDRQLEFTEKDWNQFLTKGMEIDISSDKLTTDSYKSIIVNLHLLKDGSSITPGPIYYHGMWIRDASLMIKGLEVAGYTQSAAEIMEKYAEFFDPSGRINYSISDLFEGVHQEEYDACGQFIWTIVQYYRTTKDKDWLKDRYHMIRQVALFIGKLRKETKHKKDIGTLHYGLMPKSWSAEHLGPANYFYYDDFWGLCGLREVRDAAKALGEKEDVALFEAEFKDFEKCIWDSIEKTLKERDAECLPACPYNEVTDAIIGNISCFWPCKLVDPQNKVLKGVLDTLYEKFMINNCWFSNQAWGGYGAILTWPIANCFLHKHDFDKVRKIYSWTLKNTQSPTHSFPEGINYQTLHCSGGDGYEAWGAAEYVMLLRNMLLLEEDDHILFIPCGFKEWFKDRSVIKVLKMPTNYGEISFKVTPNIEKENTMTIEIDLKGQAPKGGYIFSSKDITSKKIQKVKVDGKNHDGFSKEKVNISGEAKNIEIIFN